ncbi:MAG TPA: uL15m family ribosomal protein [Methanoregulaceae archaeon]|nr:uL15m family ribosomal protein [Methanoregulaceae archaeon]
MPVNKRSKFRGSRTCGGGTHKNRRGAGNRGGRGRAGINAHHFVRYYREMGGPVFGKDGFHNPTSTRVRAVDISIIDRMVPALLANGLAVEEEGIVTIDAGEIGIDKVLGSGNVTRKIKISAGSFSVQAKSKIEQSGGQALIV